MRVKSVRKFFKIFFPLVLFLTGVPAFLWGADTVPSDDQLFLKLNQEVQSLADKAVMTEAPEAPLDPALVRKLFAYSPFAASDSDFQKDIILKKSALVERELGFKITGFYQHNVSDGLFDNEDTSTRDGGYVGLEWDLLKDGLLDSKRNRSIVGNDLKIQELLDSYLRKEEKVPYVYYYIIYCFNTAKIEKLQERLAYIERYEDVSLMLYYFRYTSWEDIIRVKQEKAEVETMLDTYIQFNRELKENGVEGVNTALLPLLDVNLQGLLQAVREDDTYRKVLALENEKRLTEQELLSDIQLKAFARYYSHDAFSSDSSNDAAVGLYFKIPLPLKSGYRDLAALENRRAEFRLARQTEAAVNQVKDSYYEYRYKLKDAVTSLYRKEVIKERLRRETVRRTFDDPAYTPLQTFHLVNELHAVEFEYIDIRQQLYLKLLDIYRHCKEDALLKNVSAANLSVPERRYTGERSMYVWSSQFNELDNQFIFAYLKNQEIGDVLLSFGEKVDRNKLKGFLAGAGERKVRVQAMLGENSLISSLKREGLAARLEEAAAYGFAGVHLDIEPQVFADWKERKEEYLKEFVATLQFVRSKLPAGRTLTVSIPVFYPPDSLREIFGIADKVYVMAYGTSDVEKLKRRLAEEVSAGRDKVVLALRPADFKNRYEMEKFAVSAMEALGIGKVAFHDLKGMLEMDEAGISRRNSTPRRESN